MAQPNLINFCLCFAGLFVTLYSVPLAWKVFVSFCVIVVLLHLSGWLMEWTRRYVLNPKVSSAGRAVLVTGCDSGFGYLLARRLDKLGYHVFACCLNGNGQGAQDLQSSCSSRLTVLELDVTDDSSVEKALDVVQKNLRENVLWAIVNNAGIILAGEIDWCPLGEFQKVVEVNTMGVLRVTKAFLPLIRDCRGRIINHNSVSAKFTISGITGYSMSKSAVRSLSDGLRIEMKKWDVRVIDIQPALYRTPMTDEETVHEILENAWRKTPKETKAVYGRRYFEAFKRSSTFLVSRSSPRVEDVLDCFEDAVTSEQPLRDYFPCSFPQKVLVRIVMALPPVVNDTIQKFILAFSTVPDALYQREKQNQS